ATPKALARVQGARTILAYPGGGAILLLCYNKLTLLEVDDGGALLRNTTLPWSDLPSLDEGGKPFDRMQMTWARSPLRALISTHTYKDVLNFMNGGKPTSTLWAVDFASKRRQMVRQFAHAEHDSASWFLAADRQGQHVFQSSGDLEHGYIVDILELEW